MITCFCLRIRRMGTPSPDGVAETEIFDEMHFNSETDYRV